ncbi:MAG TPA: hypothetical protein VFQ06_04015 [Nitrospira sp.]|nr:hypothetical protein [Nitrospira sp.]
MMTAFLVEAAVGFALSLVFVLLYAFRSNWRETAIGRNVMAFMAALMILLGMLLAGRIKNAVWDNGGMPAWAWVIAFGAFDLIIAWRVALLVKAQKG